MSHQPLLLSPSQFDRCAARWLKALSAPFPDKLQRSFLVKKKGKDVRMLGVNFSMETIWYLISTVGATYVEARFVLLPAEIAAEKNIVYGSDQFTVVLYATDPNGMRLSAYYLGMPLVHTRHAVEIGGLIPEELPGTEEVGGDGGESDGATEIPHGLVGNWLTYWKDAPEIKSAMFAQTRGPLQGYSFILSDFREPLFRAVQKIGNDIYRYTFRVDFGLHQYYAATPTITGPTQTFGLVLRLNPKLVREVAPGGITNFVVADDEVTEPFYDMSCPCPPGH